jgi:hypothetical protein
MQIARVVDRYPNNTPNTSSMSSRNVPVPPATLYGNGIDANRVSSEGYHLNGINSFAFKIPNFPRHFVLHFHP